MDKVEGTGSYDLKKIAQSPTMEFGMSDSVMTRSKKNTFANKARALLDARVSPH